MYNKILLPLDGSSTAEQALPHAVNLAERFQSKLILLKVLVPLASTINLPPAAVKRAEETTGEIAKDYLDTVAARIRGKDFLVSTMTINGRPHEKIVHYSEKEQVDIVVMCTRGQSGLSRWLMGSVADRVVRSVNIPVFLIHAAIGTKKDK